MSKATPIRCQCGFNITHWTKPTCPACGSPIVAAPKPKPKHPEREEALKVFCGICVCGTACALVFLIFGLLAPDSGFLMISGHGLAVLVAIMLGAPPFVLGVILAGVGMTIAESTKFYDTALILQIGMVLLGVVAVTLSAWSS